MTYYNEIDAYAAKWLRNLANEKLISDGMIDARSITEVQPDDLAGFRRCHFFAGIGGWELALRLAGWPEDRPVWTGSCPCQPFSGAGKKLGEKDERHLWPEFRRLIAKCKPETIFGEQVGGTLGRTWLARVYADLEALGYRVPRDKDGNYEFYDLPVASVGSPHIRQRLYWVADRHCVAAGNRERGPRAGPRVRRCGPGVDGFVGRMDDGLRDGSSARRLHHAEHDGIQLVATSGTCRLGDGESVAGRLSAEQRQKDLDTERPSPWDDFDLVGCRDGKARRIESGSCPLAHGIPRNVGELRTRIPGLDVGAARTFRCGTLKGYGNAIVPQVAAEFIRVFLDVTTTNEHE